MKKFLPVVIFVFSLFSIDVISLNVTRIDLEHLSQDIAMKISFDGGVSEDLLSFLKEENVEFSSDAPLQENLSFGEQFDFSLTRKYSPILYHRKQIEVRVKRLVIIGYYD